MSPRQKIVMAISDFFLSWLGLLLALCLRVDFNGDTVARYLDSQLWFFNVIGLGTVLVFFLFGLYDRFWRYAGVRELSEVVAAVSIVLAPCQLLVMSGRGIIYPRSALLLAWFTIIALCGGIRFLLRVAAEVRAEEGEQRQVFIVGTDEASESVFRDLKRGSRSLQVKGFVQTNPERPGKGYIRGVQVLGHLRELPQLLEESGVRELVLAELPPRTVGEVVRLCEGLEVAYSAIPSVADLVAGKVQVRRLRELRIEDLLERDAVTSDDESLRSYLSGKRILVTGAGGSIGAEICRQVLRFSPTELVALGRGENSIYEIVSELSNPLVIPVIANVQDRKRIEQTLAKHRPQVVFHAAAHKHVPLMEMAPAEAVSNNVGGTKNLLELAPEYGCERMVILSTDKAVNPQNIMGASKRLCELLMLKSQLPGLAAVRFGNVLGSRGSVVPTFMKQLERGGPLTVTSAEMTRFFMTIPEAVALVLQAGAFTNQGAIYVLDMGKPVKILELAENMIRLSGLEPGRDIEIEIIGTRPGEKIHEALVGEGEEKESTSAEKIDRVTSTALPPGWPGEKLQELLRAAESGEDALARELLFELVQSGSEAAKPESSTKS